MQFAPLVVRRDDAVFTLRRVSDNELHRLGCRAAAIEEDLMFWLGFCSHRRKPLPLSLPEILVAMSQRFGGSGLYFDDYKSSFCFPFHLTTAKADVRGEYLLLVSDWKGRLDARLHRLGCKRRAGLAPFEPFRDAEFSREDFRCVIGFLEGFAEGWLEARAEREPGAAIEPIPDFVNHVDAALLLYGYRDGAPFEQHFDDDDEYRAALGQIPAELSQVAIGETM